MNPILKTLIGAGAVVVAAQASAQITFYEGEGFRGRTFQTGRSIENFERSGFNDRASSAVVEGGRWEVCEDAGFGGRCVVLRPGSYDSLQGLGMQKSISSVRPLNNRREFANEAPEPLPAPNYDYRRRPNERLVQVPVTSSRAVMAQAEQRCWVEHQPVAEERHSGANLPGAVLGGVLGGILGHQVGGGTGKTVATIGGAVGGAALGSNVGNRIENNRVQNTRDVRHCDDNAANGQPQYYEVTYNFRGREHHTQMSTQPGRTIWVNRDGEPRL
ncbi:MAG: beta/gamma crystallin-related protein [Pseudomonadota bacterium]|nr:beta/gamma crystallin-related protein [Pseudomonadota bacterium]